MRDREQLHRFSGEGWRDGEQERQNANRNAIKDLSMGKASKSKMQPWLLEFKWYINKLIFC